MYFLSFSAKYFDVIDYFDCKHLHQKLIRNWTTHYEVVHTLYVPLVLPSGWCLRMQWILEYLLEVKVNWGHTQKAIPYYLLGLYFKISDEHSTPITYIWGEPPPHPSPPPSQEWRFRTIWLNSLYGENYFNWLIHHSVIPSCQFSAW